MEDYSTEFDTLSDEEKERRYAALKLMNARFTLSHRSSTWGQHEDCEELKNIREAEQFIKEYTDLQEYTDDFIRNN